MQVLATKLPKGNTVTVGFGALKLRMSNFDVAVQVLDTPGSPQFAPLGAAFYSSVSYALILFDATSLASFQEVSCRTPRPDPQASPVTDRPDHAIRYIHYITYICYISYIRYVRYLRFARPVPSVTRDPLRPSSRRGLYVISPPRPYASRCRDAVTPSPLSSSRSTFARPVTTPAQPSPQTAPTAPNRRSSGSLCAVDRWRHPCTPPMQSHCCAFPSVGRWVPRRFPHGQSAV